MIEIYIKKIKEENYFFYRKKNQKNNGIDFLDWKKSCDKSAEKLYRDKKNDTFKKFLDFFGLAESSKEIFQFSQLKLVIWKNENYKLIKLEIKGKILSENEEIQYILSTN